VSFVPAAVHRLLISLPFRDSLSAPLPPSPLAPNSRLPTTQPLPYPLLRNSKSPRSALFPGTFLVETQSTIDLLFPVALEPLSTRRRHISTKHHVDLEVGDLGTETGEPARELSAYAYWGARLAAVDDRYQSSNPQRLKQWYYDRRDKKSWTTFWFAMTAFVLAVIFGLISSVTAVMQTWKAYHR
jgi:hypothetical protein